jgi:thiol-disulfide isomerase/thioredoxin
VSDNIDHHCRVEADGYPKAFIMKARQLLLAGILARASAAPIEALAENSIMVQQTTSKAAQLPIEGEFPSLGGATGWLNSPPLTAQALRGKVVLVQVWTYSCINWLRTLPYVRAWAEKYKDQGLVVIGVQSPEFGSSTTSTMCARPRRT